MNLSKNLSAYLAILLIPLLIGCGKKDSNQYVFGYMSPGDFCQKGLAREKAYRFTNVTPFLPGDIPTGPSVEKSCSPDASSGTICQAVHCNWYASQSMTSFNNAVPTEGIAVNDWHLLTPPLNIPPTFDLKIFRVVGTPWAIEMIVNGVRYTATSDQIQVTQSQSIDVTDETWDSDTSVCVASTTQLNIFYVEFLQDVRLLSDPSDNPTNPTRPYIKIVRTTAGSPTSPPSSGDFMVVQAY